jgi:hypothetical protein
MKKQIEIGNYRYWNGAFWSGLKIKKPMLVKFISEREFILKLKDGRRFLCQTI